MKPLISCDFLLVLAVKAKRDFWLNEYMIVATIEITIRGVWA